MFFLCGNYFFSVCLIYCRIFCKENFFLFVLCLLGNISMTPFALPSFLSTCAKACCNFLWRALFEYRELSNIWLIFACNISVVSWHSDRLHFHMRLMLYIQVCSIVNLQQPWFWNSLDFLFVKLIIQLSDFYCFIFFCLCLPGNFIKVQFPKILMRVTQKRGYDP